MLYSHTSKAYAWGKRTTRFCTGWCSEYRTVFLLVFVEGANKSSTFQPLYGSAVVAIFGSKPGRQCKCVRSVRTASFVVIVYLELYFGITLSSHLRHRCDASDPSAGRRDGRSATIGK
jgi:hypothetical protein